MNPILNKYLEEAKNNLIAKSPVDLDETREILAKSDTGTKTSNYHNAIKHFNGVKKMITYSSLVSLFVGMLLLFYPKQQQNSSLSEAETNKNKTSEVSETSEVYNAKSDKSNKTDARIDERGNTEKADGNTKAGEKSVYIGDQSIPKEQRVEIPVLVLNGNELAGLNLNKSDGKIELIVEENYDYKDIEQDLGEKLEAKKYPQSGISHRKFVFENDKSEIFSEYLPYTGWDMTKNLNCSPINSYRFSTSKKHGGSSTYSYGFTNKLVHPKYYIQINLERNILDSTLTDYFKRNPGVVPDKMILITNKENIKIASKMLPVIARWEKDDKIEAFIFWYIPTPELLGKLPVDSRASVLNYLKPVDSVDCPDCPAENFSKKKVELPRIQSIAGIESLELTPDELKNIEITYKDGKYVSFTQDMLDLEKTIKEYPEAEPMIRQKLKEFGFDDNFKKGIMRSWLYADINSTSSDGVKYTGWDLNKPSQTLPLGVTIVHESYTYNKYKKEYEHSYSSSTNFPTSLILPELKISSAFARDSNGNLIPRIDRILPVKIFTGTKDSPDSSKIDFANITFWFYVNREFAELLPERYRIPILHELDIIASVESGEISPQEACIALKGEKSYFDLCKLSTVNINNLVEYPNPLRGNTINLNFQLSEPSELSIDLYSYSGEFIRNLSPYSSYKPGNLSLRLQLDQPLPEGIFMIVLSDKKGNQAIQKVVVMK
jgi:hypothetical protein